MFSYNGQTTISFQKALPGRVILWSPGKQRPAPEKRWVFLLALVVSFICLWPRHHVSEMELGDGAQWWVTRPGPVRWSLRPNAGYRKVTGNARWPWEYRGLWVLAGGDSGVLLRGGDIQAEGWWMNVSAPRLFVWWGEETTLSGPGKSRCKDVERAWR